VLPKQKIASLLNESADSVGGLGPALQRLVDSTQSIVGDFEANMSDVDDIIDNAAPILDSQVDSSDSIAQFTELEGAHRRARAQRPAGAEHLVESGADGRSGRRPVQRRSRRPRRREVLARRFATIGDAGWKDMLAPAG
jgi:hypothetical protein